MKDAHKSSFLSEHRTLTVDKCKRNVKFPFSHKKITIQFKIIVIAV